MNTLTKTQMILTKRDEFLNDHVFGYDDPDWFRKSEVILDEDVWEDMGRPQVITVTVEPGDLLN